MSRTSKRLMSRSSKPRRASRRASRRLTANGTVERRTFGKEIDPDKVSGALGSTLDGAMNRFEIFQQKAPQMVVRVTHDPPRQVVCIGDALSVMYRSSKWTQDGEEEVDTDYKHRHEASEDREYAAQKGVRIYENARFVDADVKRNIGVEKAPALPAAWARLGYCLGFFVRRDDDGEIHECNPRNSWLLSAPDGHTLAVYSPKPQSNGDVGFLCIFKGGKLRVLKEGIDG